MAIGSKGLTPADLDGIDVEPGAVAQFNGCNSCAWLYFPAAEEAPDPEEERRRAQADEAVAQFEEADASRSAWLAEHLGEIDPGTIVAAMAPGAEIDVYEYDVNEFCELHEVDLPMGPAVTIAAFCHLSGCPVDRFSREMIADSCRDFTALTDAMELCGYEPPVAEQRLYQVCVDAIGKEDGDE